MINSTEIRGEFYWWFLLHSTRVSESCFQFIIPSPVQWEHCSSCKRTSGTFCGTDLTFRALHVMLQL